MPANLSIGQTINGKTIVELGESNTEFDLYPVKFSDGSYGISYGSTWRTSGTLFHSSDTECERLLRDAVSMPRIAGRTTFHFLVRFRRRAGFLRGHRWVTLAISYYPGGDRDDERDYVLGC